MPDKQPLRPSQLGNLYPKAKTYDEQLADRAEVEKLKNSRRPKLITLRASFLLTVCCALVVGAVWAMPYLFVFGIMAGVFAVIGSLAVLLFYAKWLISRIIAIYNINGKNAQPLLTVYPLLLSCFVVILYLLIGWEFITSLQLAGLLLAIHFVLVFGLAGLLRNVGRA